MMEGTGPWPGSFLAAYASPPQPVAAQPSAPSASRGRQAAQVRLVECGPVGGVVAAALAPGGRVAPTGSAEAGHLEWACTPSGQWVRVRSSTAFLPNRESDKRRVEETLGLSEFGDNSTQFYAARSGLVPVGVGYDRIVYGDHGPYVELSTHHICWQTFPNFVEKPACSFFDECWTADGHTMLYAQKRPVTNKPNPPAGDWAVQNNRREGYANYLIGKFYLACEADVIGVIRNAAAQRRKRAGQKNREKGEKGEKGFGKGKALGKYDDVKNGDGHPVAEGAEAEGDREEGAGSAQAADAGSSSGSVLGHDGEDGTADDAEKWWDEWDELAEWDEWHGGPWWSNGGKGKGNGKGKGGDAWWPEEQWWDEGWDNGWWESRAASRWHPVSSENGEASGGKAPSRRSRWVQKFERLEDEGVAFDGKAAEGEGSAAVEGADVATATVGDAPVTTAALAGAEGDDKGCGKLGADGGAEGGA